MEAADSKPIMAINVHRSLAKQFREPATRGSMAEWQNGSMAVWLRMDRRADHKIREN